MAGVLSPFSSTSAFATNAGTATTATTAGTATITNALADSTGTVNVSLGTAPAVNDVLTTTSGNTAVWAPGMVLLASAGATGTQLVNTTGTIISWAAPNDGNLHRVACMTALAVTSTLTGGAIKLEFQIGGVNASPTLFAGGESNGAFQPSASTTVTIAPNTTVAVVQTSGVSSGTGTLFAELWGS